MVQAQRQTRRTAEQNGGATSKLIHSWTDDFNKVLRVSVGERSLFPINSAREIGYPLVEEFT